LVVEQFQTNRYQRLYYDIEQDLSRAGFIAQDLIPEILSRIDSLYLKTDIPGKLQKDIVTRRLIGHELEKLDQINGTASQLALLSTRLGPPDREPMEEMKVRLRELIRHYDGERMRAQEARRAATDRLLKEYGEEGVVRFRKEYHNESIMKLARNKSDLEKVRISGERFVQISYPVYQPVQSSWGRAPFMAGMKHLGPYLLTTYSFNVLVIWGMALALCLALYARLLPRLVEGRWWKILKRNRSSSSHLRLL
jgi:hypothetical protein